MQELEGLLYWMHERHWIYLKRLSGEPKPWSNDPVFQRTYFCNVFRENDKVTRFIREMYSPHVRHRFFEENIILSRFLNWPDTLDKLGYLEEWDKEYVRQLLKSIDGKVWGNAYLVSTCGRSMGKIDYLCDVVMPSVEQVVPETHSFASLRAKAEGLMGAEGISTFMAGQVVADLKNTRGHLLQEAYDWYTFALPGPGSRRGMNWVMGRKVPDKEWHSCLLDILKEVEKKGWSICAQDLQNCLCEFDKYMRVKTGTGRSKRLYDGV